MKRHLALIASIFLMTTVSFSQEKEVYSSNDLGYFVIDDTGRIDAEYYPGIKTTYEIDRKGKLIRITTEPNHDDNPDGKPFTEEYKITNHYPSESIKQKGKLNHVYLIKRLSDNRENITLTVYPSFIELSYGYNPHTKSTTVRRCHLNR